MYARVQTRAFTHLRSTFHPRSVNMRSLPAIVRYPFLVLGKENQKKKADWLRGSHSILVPPLCGKLSNHVFSAFFTCLGSEVGGVADADAPSV